MARVPPDLIERVRDAADIVDLVSKYVDLKKRGQNYFGLCPFHNEKTPSFSVAPAKEIYHCFGCGAGGSAFDFIMDYEKNSFIDTIMAIGPLILGYKNPSINNAIKKQLNKSIFILCNSFK